MVRNRYLCLLTNKFCDIFKNVYTGSISIWAHPVWCESYPYDGCICFWLQVIRDYQLIVIVCVLVGLDVLVLTVWEFTDPLKIVKYNKSLEIIVSMDYCTNIPVVKSLIISLPFLMPLCDSKTFLPQELEFRCLITTGEKMLKCF